MSSLATLTSGDLMLWLGRFWWPFVRLSALLWILPVFDSISLPVRSRVIFSALVSILLASIQLPLPVIDPFSFEALVVTVEQVCFGALMALAIRILFAILTLTGQLLSMQMGLSMAVMMDPGSGQTPLLSQLFWLMTAMLFFAIDGHLVVLAVCVDSFELWPVSSSLYQLNLSHLVGMFSWMLGAGLLLALPSIIAMLLVNLTFGIASRSAPSLNLFVLGFPMTLLLGFVAVLLTLNQIGIHFFRLSEQALEDMYVILG